MINQKWTSHISHAADDLRPTVQGTTSKTAAAAVIVMDTDAARRIPAPAAAPKKTELTGVFFKTLYKRITMAGLVPVGWADRTHFFNINNNYYFTAHRLYITSYYICMGTVYSHCRLPPTTQ
jgi:hypothetical protein